MSLDQFANQSAFKSLPQEWRDWISLNLARGCEVKGMIDVMVRDGSFASDDAAAAVAEAAGQATYPKRQESSIPDVDTGSNSIRTSDQVVDILMQSASPRIVLLGNVLRAEECAELMALCANRFERSPVVDEVSGSARVDESRTSAGAMLERGETPTVARIERRLSEIVRWPIEFGEGMQLQQYCHGNEYRSHFDWFEPNSVGAKKHLCRGGQRLATFVLYLSEVESGGGTSFPRLGLEVFPKSGSALFFQNTDVDHVPDERTLHAGSPVVRGIKVIANKWLRAERY